MSFLDGVGGSPTNNDLMLRLLSSSGLFNPRMGEFLPRRDTAWNCRLSPQHGQPVGMAGSRLMTPSEGLPTS